MLSRLISRWFQRQSTPSAVVARGPVQSVQAAPGVPEMPPGPNEDDPLDDVPRYPPFDSGIPVKPLERVLASQNDIINRVYRTAGVSREDFAELYTPAIQNLARYVHLLPATDTENHSGAGGLFCYALEIGLYSLQTANASVFPVGGGVERRFHMTPKWSLATFLAGICSQLYRTVGTMVVLTRDHQQWQPLLVPIYDWATASATDRYFIRWLEEPNIAGAQSSSAFLVNMIVPPSVMQYLASDNNLVLPAMSGAVGGGSSGDNPILKIINPITTRVRMEDQKRSARNYGHMMVGAHLEPHLIDAMLRLIKGGAWTYNNRHAVVWIGQDGVFINWPAAAGQIVSLLARDGYAGIPRDPDTLADILTRSKVFEPPRKGGKYWTISPPEVNEVVDSAVKILNPQQIFPSGFDLTTLATVTLALNPSAVVVPPSTPPTPSNKTPPVSKTPVAAAGREKTEPVEPLQSSDPVQSEIDLPTPPPHLDIPPDCDAYSDRGNLVPDDADPDPRGRDLPPESAPPKPHQTPKVHDPKKKPVGTAPPPGTKKPNSKPAPANNHPATGSGGEEPTLPGPAADRLLSMLKKENARLLKDVYLAYQQGKLKGIIASLPQGLGISHEELMGHGRPAIEFIQELSERQWLWVDKTKPTRNIHLLEVDGKQQRMIVFKRDIAVGLGFPYEES